MEKTEKMISIVYQLIGENQFLLEAIKGIKDRKYRCLEITITSDRGSLASYKDENVTIGIKDIVDSYKLAKELNCIIPSNLCFINDSKYSDFDSKDSVRDIIDVQVSTADNSIVKDILNNIDFLTNEPIFDTITIYALAYSLFHEIGHIVNDRIIPETEQMQREIVADDFAFKAIKTVCSNNEDISDAWLKGVIIAIDQMLLYLPASQEIEDKDHPHSIERMYTLLSFWGNPKNCFWELAYNMVCVWCKKNSLSITWEEENSLSFKDKFTDAYIHFRKNLR